MSTPTEVLNQIVAYCKEVGAARNGLDKALTKIQTIAEEALHPSKCAVNAVWVKATERLPDKGGINNKVIVRGVLNEQGYANHFFVAYGFRNFSKEKQEMYFEYGSKSFLTNDLEWLDESPSLVPDQAGKEDAVALLNWMTENGIVINRDGEIWQKPNNKLFTPDQLFDLYQQSKNK